MRKPRRPAGVLWLVALSAAVLARPAVVDAACPPPEVELLWSYPSDGDTGVPTNATFAFLGTTYVREVRLDGQLIERESIAPGTPAAAFDPGLLDPDTDYELTVQLEAWEREEEVVVSFRTGDGPGSTEFGPIEWVGATATTDWGHFSEFCQAVVEAQDCYDKGGPYAHVILDVDQEAVLYLLSERSPSGDRFHRGVVWPGECGAPSNYVGVGSSSTCYRVHALDESGNVASTDEACWSSAELLDPGDAGAPGDASVLTAPRNKSTGGCSATRSATGLPMAFVVLAVLARATRRRPRSTVARP